MKPTNGPITQKFGVNKHFAWQPITGHVGLDFGVPLGTTARAISDGEILWADWGQQLGGALANRCMLIPYSPASGILVLIQHDGWVALYAHLSKTTMHIGDKVKRGDKIGETGNTGNSTGPHLHFETFLTPASNSPHEMYSRYDPMLQIKLEDRVASKNKPTKPKLKKNQRWVGPANLRQRDKPIIKGSEIVRVIDANTKETFTGYVRGQMVKIGKIESNVWYVDNGGPGGAKRYVWSGGFTTQSTRGLKRHKLEKASSKPDPKPKPKPKPKKPTMDGIDISGWQKGINLKAVDPEFVIIKATGGDGFISNSIHEQYADAKKLGMRKGMYHFAHENGWQASAKAEAEHFLKVTKDYWDGETLPVLDWEGDNSHDTAWALEWLETVTERLGVKPLIYMNLSTANSHNWSKVQKAGYKLWLAQYPTNAIQDGYGPLAPLQAAHGWDTVLWQYSQNGRLPGYSGALDLNEFYGDGGDWDALVTPEQKPEPKPEPTPEPKPEPEKPSGEPTVEDFLDWVHSEFLADWRSKQ